MVLSHKKLKWKLKVESGVAHDGLPELLSTEQTKPEEGAKRKKTTGRSVEIVDKILEAVSVPEQLLDETRKKRKKERWPIHPVVAGNGSEAVDEKMKYRKAKKLKSKLADAVDCGKELASDQGLSNADNEVEDAKSHDNNASEQNAVDEIKEERSTTRERKGKKKKKTLDRWGERVREEVTDVEGCDQGEHHHKVESHFDTSEEQYDLKKVFVGGMPYITTEDDIQNFFAECGSISELDCMTFADSGNFRGVAFVTFQTEDAAKKALELDGADMGGRFLKIVQCKIKPRAAPKVSYLGPVKKTPGCTSAYIGNLSWDISEDNLRKMFRKAYRDTKIDAIRLAYDQSTGEFRGYGHVDFGNDESLEEAMKLDQKDLFGRPLKISYSVPKVGNVKKGNVQLSKCFNCGDEGHKSFNCPEKRDK